MNQAYRGADKISLFSQSLFSLPLKQAIEATAEIGFSAIELACKEPHFDISMATEHPKAIARQIHEAGLEVSALSLFSGFTNTDSLDTEIQRAQIYLRLAPLFHTEVLKITPGPPASAAATDEHWRLLSQALDALVPIAEELGVKLAFETHMRQLTDTLAGIQRLLELTSSDRVGLTVDFSNLMFAGERMSEVFAVIRERLFNTHLKNGVIGADGSWHFYALDTGLTDYDEVFDLLRQTDYNGYLTIECLGPDAQEKPIETAQRDLDILKHYLG